MNHVGLNDGEMLDWLERNHFDTMWSANVTGLADYAAAEACGVWHVLDRGGFSVGIGNSLRDAIRAARHVWDRPRDAEAKP